MMEKHYRFAGIEITIDIPGEHMYENERNLAPFRVDAVTDPHRFRYRLCDSLDSPTGPCIANRPGLRVYRDGERRISYVGTVHESWEHACTRALHDGKDHQVQVQSAFYPERISAKAVLNSLELERLVTEGDGFLFHCAYVAVEDRAILFTAPSGVGKSTQAELWHSLRGAEIVNGDRAVLRSTGGRVLASGIPFSGSSSYCLNRELEVAAIVYLGQAPVTTIRRLKGYGAFSRIWEGCSVHTWDPEQMARVSALAAEIAGAVPIYHLMCTPDESAVNILEHAMRKGDAP